MTALSMRRGWCPGTRRPMKTGDGLLVRVHPPGGILSAAQAAALADAAEAFGNGLLDVTARGNLQVRGVSERTHAPLMERLFGLGLVERDGDGPHRLTLVSPLAGIDPSEVFDAAALAAEIEAAAAHLDLPPKVHVAVDGGGALRPDPGADVVLAAAGDGIAIGVARGHGYVWSTAVARERACAVTIEILERFSRTRGAARRLRDLPAGATTSLTHCMVQPIFQLAENDAAAAQGGEPPRRAGLFPCRPPATSTPCATDSPPPCGEGPGVGVPHDDPDVDADLPRRAASLHERVALLLALPFGRATAAQLRAAAAWSGARAEVRLSFTRGLLIPGLGSDEARSVAREAQATGFVVDPQDPRLALVACPGAPACGRGNTTAAADALGLAEAIAPLARAGARIHVSGCAKGCAHPRAADLTLVGRPDGRYDVVPGGATTDAAVATLPLRLIADILRETPDPASLAAAFRGHRP